VASMSRKVPGSTVRRLSLYLRTLETVEAEGISTLSSGEMAERSGTTAAQVRKDLSHFGSFGKRGTGYPAAELARELREILGLHRTWRVALVGAGRIGSALFEYGDFRHRGFRIAAVLDTDPAKVGTYWGEVRIEPARALEQVIQRESVEIVILAVPAAAVQAVMDRVVAAGVRAILNFAPTQLRVPPGVTVNDVNLALELEVLSFALAAGREVE
jgi:redox-sensing transcriptional repressor